MQNSSEMNFTQQATIEDATAITTEAVNQEQQQQPQSGATSALTHTKSK